MGYTEYKTDSCDEASILAITPTKQNLRIGENITAPTCTEGTATQLNTCVNCGDEFVPNYTERETA